MRLLLLLLGLLVSVSEFLLIEVHDVHEYDAADDHIPEVLLKEGLLFFLGQLFGLLVLLALVADVGLEGGDVVIVAGPAVDVVAALLGQLLLQLGDVSAAAAAAAEDGEGEELAVLVEVEGEGERLEGLVVADLEVLDVGLAVHGEREDECRFIDLLLDELGDFGEILAELDVVREFGR